MVCVCTCWPLAVQWHHLFLLCVLRSGRGLMTSSLHCGVSCLQTPLLTDRQTVSARQTCVWVRMVRGKCNCLTVWISSMCASIQCLSPVLLHVRPHRCHPAQTHITRDHDHTAHRQVMMWSICWITDWLWLTDYYKLNERNGSALSTLELYCICWLPCLFWFVCTF